MSESSNLVILREMDIPCAGRDCTKFATFDRLIIDRGTSQTSYAISLCRHCNRKLNVDPTSVLGEGILADISADEMVNDDEAIEVPPGGALYLQNNDGNWEP